MNLNLNNQLFVVGGSTSGFGKAIAGALVEEGARVIAVARNENKLKALQEASPQQVETVCCDITAPDAAEKIVAAVGDRPLHGMLVNAGGPPAMTVLETTLDDWDNAYKSVLRWKIDLTRRCLPAMMKNNYGRVVYIESSSVKQPIENLVLSTAMRLAVVGYVKTLSQEISRHGITLNVLAPGSHDTAAIERLIKKKNEQTGMSAEDARQQLIQQTNVGFLGNAADFASLAVWLLSPHSRFITGQTISVAGGVIKGIMG